MFVAHDACAHYHNIIGEQPELPGQGRRSGRPRASAAQQRRRPAALATGSQRFSLRNGSSRGAASAASGTSHSQATCTWPPARSTTAQRPSPLLLPPKPWWQSVEPRPRLRGDPTTPADVYVHGQAVGLPKWQGWAKAAREKLKAIVEDAHFPSPGAPAEVAGDREVAVVVDVHSGVDTDRVGADPTRVCPRAVSHDDVADSGDCRREV